MGRVRDAIVAGNFPDFLRSFFRTYYSVDRSTKKNTKKNRKGSKSDTEESNEEQVDVIYPKWCVDALRTVGVDLLEGVTNAKVIDRSGAKWDYASTDS